MCSIAAVSASARDKDHAFSKALERDDLVRRQGRMSGYCEILSIEFGGPALSGCVAYYSESICGARAKCELLVTI